MKQRLGHVLKLFLALSLVASLASGCGSQTVSASYPLESVTQNGPETSKVYRAVDKTVPQVAQELAEQQKPREMSKEDPERMFLVYSDEWYHLQRDAQKPSDTLIEVDNQEFVRQNYDFGFLEGYLLAGLLDKLFDSHKRYPGQYRGYSSKDIYKSKTDYRKPTEQEKKANPPLTVSGKGSIIKRGDKSTGAGTSIGSGGDITKKNSGSPPSTSGSTGTISKTSGSSGTVQSDSSAKSGTTKIAPPKNNSPPKTRVGGSGRITKRR
jgi:hypothetical protein